MPINYFNGIWRLSALNVVLNDISLHTNQMLSQPVDLIKIIISAIYYRSESLKEKPPEGGLVLMHL